MKRQFIVLLMVASMIILILSGCTAPAPTPTPAPTPVPKTTPSPATIQLSLATHNPPTHYLVKEGFEPWGKELEKRTEGRVKVTIHPSSALGKQNEMYDVVRKGVANIGLVSPASHPGLFPLCDLYEIPYLVPYDKAGRLAGNTVFKKYIEPTEFKELKVLWLHRWESQQIFTAKKPVRKLDDVKGLTVGISGAKSIADFVKLLGGSPEKVIIGDIYTSMERGIIDGQVYPVQVLVSYKLYEVSKYLTMMDAGSNIAVMAINKQTWDSLPSDVKKIMDDLNPWVAELMVKASDVTTEGAFSTVKQKGLEIIEFSSAEKAQWVKVADSLENGWIKEADNKGLPAKQIVSEIKQMVSK